MGLPLDGYTVIDLSVGIAGAYCTKLLADGGADGDQSRAAGRRSTASVVGVRAPKSRPATTARCSVSSRASKHSVVVDPETPDDVELLRGLAGDGGCGGVVARAAIVALDDVRAGSTRPTLIPHLTVTSITPFGLEGPWADKPATEFTVQAWSGGVIGLGRGAQDRAPLFVGGQIGEWLAGAFAARGHDGACERHGDSSTCRCSKRRSSCLTYYSVSFIDLLGRPFRDRRRLTIPGRRNGGRRSGGAGLRDRRSSGSTCAR